MFEWGDPIDHLVRFPQLQMQFDQVAIHANGDIVVSPYIPLIIGNVRKHSLQELSLIHISVASLCISSRLWLDTRIVLP